MSLRPDAESEIKLLYVNSLPSRGIGPDEVAVAIDDAADNPDANRRPGNKLPVLSNDELQHLLACFKGLSDPTLARTNSETYLQIVIDELKRSGRKEEADTMLKETIQNAKSQIEIAWLIPSAVDRNDFDGAMKLLHRLSEMPSDNSVGQVPRSAVGVNMAQRMLSPDTQVQTLGRLMDKRVQKKMIGDVLTLWDWYVPTATARREQAKASAAGRRGAPMVQSGPVGYVLIWRANSQQYENLDFPSTNDIFDQPSIQLLRQVYTIYKEADSPGELIEHIRRKLADANTPTVQKTFLKFGLGYLHWWQGEKDDALAVLTEATDELQDNHEMRFELARVHEKRGEHEQALEIIDSLPVADQQAVQKREITALRMAVNSGNIDRARLAAERLFGLRLDSNVQIQLAQQMHQLGMHEQAEAVLARAGRQAGNRTDVLANLMQQYQSQGKNDVAVQMALSVAAAALLSKKSHKSREPAGQQFGTSARIHCTETIRQASRDDSEGRRATQELSKVSKAARVIDRVLHGEWRRQEGVGARLQPGGNETGRPAVSLQSGQATDGTRETFRSGGTLQGRVQEGHAADAERLLADHEFVPKR